MNAELARSCRRTVLATVFALTAGGGAGAFVPDERWEGRWEPRDSCRDRSERRVTAQTVDGELHGQVHNPPGEPGVFVAEIKPNGRFVSIIKRFNGRDFKVFGKVTPAEIEARWTGPKDCGPGRLVLHPVPPGSDSASPGTQPSGKDTAQARAALETLRAQGLITEEEYQAKLEELAPRTPARVTAPGDVPPADPRLVELDDLLISGAISADEYLARRQAITGSTD